LTSKVSRAVLIASLAVGASGLVAVPAEAANGVSTANYYVNQPAVTGAVTVTPESALVAGAVDTGGNPETLLPVPATGLTWDGNVAISAGVKWADNTTGNYVPDDGIPTSGSSSNVSATITDAGDSAINGVPIHVSNADADNFSDVTFEADPVSDYNAATGTPGARVQFAQDVGVPTATGISSVRATIGAFGQAAQTNSGLLPLKPGTKYYYWVVQQAGGTDAATNVNIAQWAAPQTANPTDKCYPNAAIAADPTLASYTSSTQITVTIAGVTSTAPALQGPCKYYYGNTGGALYYQSPNGTFTTPKLGKVIIAKQATLSGSKVTLGVTDSSAYKASGTIDLKVGRKLAGTAKFSLRPHAKGTAKVTLSARGEAALRKRQTVKVAPVSQVATVASVSNWDQPLVGRSVKL